MRDVSRLPKTLVIARGCHSSYGNGACALELVDYLARRRERVLKSTKLTDRPACVSPVLAAFVRRWNDDLPDDATWPKCLRCGVKVLSFGRTPTAECVAPNGRIDSHMQYVVSDGRLGVCAFCRRAT